MQVLIRSVLVFLLLAIGSFSFGADALDLLEAHCVRCHGGEKTKGGLDITTRETLIRGGESGADLNLIVRSIRHDGELHMPYKEDKLPDESIRMIAEWLKNGVVYSRKLKAVAVADKKAEKKHWAFEAVKRPVVPGNSNFENPIDRFVFQKLSEAGLSFSKMASREQLIRRVTFDLIGLPATPAEIGLFANDTSPRAYERLVDRLLASPHYGERWGRHWLDLARFAESDGFEHDAVRPHAWRYRDYVVKAFNDDKPYDRFIREQIAGDEFFSGDPEALTATAFNLLGPDMVDSSDQVQRRHNTLNDMTDTAALAFLGLTMGCARCHDHKFEPISQKDYYSFQAFFTPAKFQVALEIPTVAERKAHSASLRSYDDQPAVRELAELEKGPREKVRKRKIASLAPEAQMAHNTLAEQRNAEQANLVLETQDKVIVSEVDLAAEFSVDEKARRKKLVEAVKKIARPPALPMTLAMTTDTKVAPKAFVLHRGEYSQPEDEVSARGPAILPPSKGEARASLADWIASPENPLTARVMVNRLWQHHFGRGLVASPSNFGTQGQLPTHPELLEWLASEFIARGWSLKEMHKLMLMSQTYQQSSTGAAGASIDPQNKLYWRMNRLRLEGEVIRDSLLAISGELRMDMGGPGVFPPIPKELFQGAAGWPSSQNDAKQSRRSIYIFARRNLRFPFLEVFDLPDNNLSCPIREQSTTAPQSLTLLNSDEVVRASKITAQHLERDFRATDERVAAAYRFVLGRAPSDTELQIAREFLAQSPLHEFCRALFNLNDFVYVE